MAVIRPFQGLRYSAEAGTLGILTAPPYDVISEQERISFLTRSPHNIVHLTLPEQKPDDRSKFDVVNGMWMKDVNRWVADMQDLPNVGYYVGYWRGLAASRTR